jgi:hypothetical protein
MMSTNVPKKTYPNAETETRQNPFDNIEDEVVGVGFAPVNGDKYVLDEVVDEDPMSGARMVAFVTLVSAVAVLGLAVAAIIKIAH